MTNQKQCVRVEQQLLILETVVMFWCFIADDYVVMKINNFITTSIQV